MSDNHPPLHSDETGAQDRKYARAKLQEAGFQISMDPAQMRGFIRRMKEDPAFAVELREQLEKKHIATAPDASSRDMLVTLYRNEFQANILNQAEQIAAIIAGTKAVEALSTEERSAHFQRTGSAFGITPEDAEMMFHMVADATRDMQIDLCNIRHQEQVRRTQQRGDNPRNYTM